MCCYAPSDNNATIARTDSDGIYEVEITTFWWAEASTNGATTITLKHQTDIKDGTCSTDDTDVEVTFVTEIQ